MKKNIVFYVFMLIAGAIYSQNDSTKIALLDGTVLNIVSQDSLKALTKKITNNEMPKSDEIGTNNSQPATDANANAIQAFVEKEINQSTALGKGLIISGTNVIIGSNNVFIIVDDKNKAKDLLSYIKNDNSKVKIPYSENLFEHFAFSLRASTLGAGVEVATTISKNIKLRAGFSAFDFSDNYSINIDDDAIREAVVGKYNPDYKVKGAFELYNGHLLVDLHPMRNGIFHFTGGVFYGSNKIKASGRLVDPTTGYDALLDPSNIAWPSINLADYQLQIDNTGRLNAEAIIGNRFKPYAGIGLGRSIPRSRFGIMFELGVMYQGDITLKQNGVKMPKIDDLTSSFADSKDYINWLRWMPMVNLQLTYRFK